VSEPPAGEHSVSRVRASDPRQPAGPLGRRTRGCPRRGPGRARRPGAARTAAGRIARAGAQLTGWADRWRPHLSDLPTEPTQLARVTDRFDDRPALWRAFDASARRAAEQDHPEHAQLRATADATRQAHQLAQRALAEARRERDVRLAPFGPIAWAPDPEGRLADLERDLAATSQQLTDARARITRLAAEPALRAQPPDLLAREHDAWRARHDAAREPARTAVPGPQNPAPAVRSPHPEDLRYLDSQRARDRSLPR
jgi:exodeoxyribonuclease V alpha subunit